MIFEYSQDKQAQEVLKGLKRRRAEFVVAFIALTVCYLATTIAVAVGFLREANAKNVYLYRRLLVVAVVYLLLCIIVKLILKARTNKYALDILNMRRPECLLNASIYTFNLFDRSTIMKVLHPVKRERGMAVQLNNIAVAYYEKGDPKRAMEVVSYLDTECTIKKEAAKPWRQFAILHIKATVFFDKGDKDEYKKCSVELRKVIKTLAGAGGMSTRLDVMDAVLDDDIARVNEACDKMSKSRNISDQVYAAFYRAQVMEKKGEKGFEKYYKFAAENGGELILAKKARAKIGANEKA